MRRRRYTPIIVAATVFAAAISIADDVQSGTISTWNSSTGDWNDATRWSTNPFFPNNGNGAPSYDAVIGAGAVNLNIDVSLLSLSLNGGALNGSGNLTTDTLTLNGGTLSTTGTLSAGKAVLTVGTPQPEPDSIGQCQHNPEPRSRKWFHSREPRGFNAHRDHWAW